ncbi:MAG TPA: bifunctional helix-turn-helix transcriptional regulator/GNAT family N-acetyltransferase [Rugosimonospora sp.]|nr:bifunctional helix-turn-helix transcriptional regulator/GNAT family N-acetyltransferase [Rugosimonospora sp.]
MSDLVATVRDFNRFYTNVIGVLRGGLLDTPYTLTEARVIFELAQRDAVEVADLRRDLDIDAGYLSRILGRFASDGLIVREPSGSDKRRQVIRLTPAGRDAYRVLDERSGTEIRALLDRLGADQRHRLAGAMATIREVLGEAPRPRAYLLRPPVPGDLGWVIARNGALYAEEYGWDATYEALVARIVADYVANRDPEREAAWIAELDGAPVGCVFCVKRDEETAQLRLLLVEPAARGLGIGGRLVAECLAYAKQAGYRRMALWTNDVLAGARRIYERAGFTLGEEDRHRSFGRDLVGQTWSKDL